MTSIPERFPRVAGYCPMGCGSTLFLGSGGYLTCSLAGCPDPARAHDILTDDVSAHVVELGADTFTVRHPLRERANDEMLTCDLHVYLAGLGGPPRQPGTYWAVPAEGSWKFSPRYQTVAP